MTGAAFWFLDKSLIRPPESSEFSVIVLSFRSSPSRQRRNKGHAWREPLSGCSEILNRPTCLIAPPRVTVPGSGGYQTQEVIWSVPHLRGRMGYFSIIQTRGRNPREVLSGQVLSLKWKGCVSGCSEPSPPASSHLPLKSSFNDSPACAHISDL